MANDNAVSEIGDRQFPSFDEARKTRDDIIWSQLANISLIEAVNSWLFTLSPLTEKNYRSGMNELAKRRLINPEINLQSFSLINHDSVVDAIKQQADWSEATKQARAACYISFTSFISRRTQGIIKKAIPNREGTGKTFFKVREKVATHAMNQSEWLRFFQELECINFRDCLIAKITLQGGKRIQEVLSLHTDQISFTESNIRFIQSKTKGYHKETIIFYPQTIMEQIDQYLSGRTGLVFVTRNNGEVTLRQLHNSFSKASKQAKTPFRVTPHVLRASAITFLKNQGFSDSEIMKVTGHASAEMINAYDKASLEDNPSKNIFLIN